MSVAYWMFNPCLLCWKSAFYILMVLSPLRPCAATARVLQGTRRTENSFESNSIQNGMVSNTSESQEQGLSDNLGVHNCDGDKQVLWTRTWNFNTNKKLMPGSLLDSKATRACCQCAIDFLPCGRRYWFWVGASRIAFLNQAVFKKTKHGHPT